ncbi:MAG: DUF222 domain-containing protein [Acidimicrobiales bacterium]
MAIDLADVVDRAAGVPAELGSVDLDGLGDDKLSDAVLTLQRFRGRLDVAEAQILSRWDAQGCWRASGAKTGAAWLAWRQRLPIQTARQRLRHARALRTLPTIEEAWAHGEIDRTHVTTLLGARTARTADVFDRDHKTLLDIARTGWFGHFKRACDHFELAVDPDGAEQGADDDHNARAVHLSQSFGGIWFGKITLDPVSGEIVDTTLRLIERELFDADWAAAKQRLGRDPMIMELDRTPAQRRADALTEMATRARTAREGGRRPAPLFTVLVGYETFAGPLLETHNRTTITPGTAAGWLDEADIERIVFDSPSRVIDVGQRRRFVTGALRRAIEVRDRTCFHPTCNEVPHRPEIDHIHEYAKGGETTQINNRLGCGFHNRWRNHHPDPDDDPDPPG